MTTEVAASPVCQLSQIGKSYGATHALASVDLAVTPGLVHAVLGENGAGKSTLMKILAGAEQPDTGSIRINGNEVRFRSVRDANRAGIATVFQDPMLFGSLDAVHNICAGQYSTRAGLINRSAMEARVRPLLAELGVTVDLTRPVETLPLPTRQMLEIAKAMLVDSRILILDEPNSALQQKESERLFEVVNRLRRRGVAIIYVSHRLEEVFRLADVVSVLRNGRLVHSGPAAQLTIPATIDLMLGRQRAILERTRSGRPTLGLPAVSLANVSGKSLRDVSITAASGEVVGLAGLAGSGCTDVLRLLFGQLGKHVGQVEILEVPGAPRNTASAVRRGIAFVPSDRAAEGLALESSIMDNAVMVHVAVWNKSVVLRQSRLATLARKGLAGIAARVPSLTAPAGSLSGGNQQKVVFAKWRVADPRLILLEDPARGVDVGAKAEIFTVVRELAKSGSAVLFVSTDFDEYSFVCDRVLVMRAGTIVAELDGREATEHALLSAIHGETA